LNPADGIEVCAPLVDGAPVACENCSAPLCLRKQVLNLAVGNIEAMHCLRCLGMESEQEPDEMLAGMKLYVLSRDCLRKEWEKYECASYCPQPESCYPSICFADAE
jgi:hypothetical protein